MERSQASASLTVRLTDELFRLCGPDAEWRSRTLRRLAPFVVPDDPNAFLVEVSCDRVVAETDLEAERSRPPEISGAGRTLRIAAGTFTAEADLAARRATLSGPPYLYPLDTLLRQLLAHLLDDGLLIHAALLIDGERRAFVASGPSGSGKSTLAGLLPEHAAADELVAVRLPPAGPPVAYGLPFWKGRPRQAPLAGIHLLRHAPACARTRLDPPAALRRLAPEVLWPAGPEAAVGARLDLLAALVARVPVWELGFRPHPEVWETIAAEVAA